MSWCAARRVIMSEACSARVPAVVALQVLGVAPACDQDQETAALTLTAALSFVRRCGGSVLKWPGDILRFDG